MNCRLVLCVALSSAVLAAQEPVLTRQIDLTLTEGTAMAAAASPDRRWIAIDLVGGIWVLPFTGGEAKRITPDTLEARQPTWSPDGQRIAFQGFGDDGAWHIYAVRRDGGEPRALTSGIFDDREPAWSHDGRRIAFSSDRYGGISTIWTLVVPTGEVRQVSTRDGTMPTWSPTDQEITFISRDSQAAAAGRKPAAGVWMADATGGERLLPYMPETVAAAWSPDGQRIAMVQHWSLIQVLAPLPGTGVVREADAVGDRDVFPFRPQWPSEDELLYTADGHIRLLRSHGRPQTIPFTAKLSLQRASYEIAHRPLEPAVSQTVRGVVTPRVAPNGRAIAFVALGDVWILPAGGTPIRVTDDEAMELDPAWSPDSTRLAFASDRTGRMQIWMHDFRTNAETQLTDERVSATGPAWSPDGNQLAYLSDGDRSMAAMTLVPDEHRGVIQPALVRGPLGRPTWSADNHTIAAGALFPFSDRAVDGLNQLLLFRLEPSGTFSTALAAGRSAGNRDGNGPVWSPDGNRMTYVSEGRLWSVDVDYSGGATGPPTAIAPYVPRGDELPESPSWEGDARHIVYQTPSGLRRIPRDGGVPETIDIRMSWTPALPDGGVVVHAGHVVDGVIEGERGETDIVVDRAGVIREISGHRDELHTGRVVVAANETAMPGLVDMHARFDRSDGRNFNRAMLAYGVTTVRIPGMNAYAALAEQEAIATGRRPGPRIITSGDTLEGVRVFDAGGVFITSDSQLDQELERATTLGADFVATGVRLPDRFQRRIVNAAHQSGTPVASSILFPAVAFGADFVERLGGQTRAGYPTTRGEGGQLYRDVLDLIVKSGVTTTASLAVEGGFEARLSGDRSLLFDPRLALYPLPVVSELTDLATKLPPPGLDAAMKRREAAVKTLVESGGKIVAASGSPIVPYGLGLHAELESLVHAGLTPFQALQMATIQSARALGLDADIGTIEVGKLADFAFVDGDPLADIRNARKVKRVMKGGRVYTVEELLEK